PRSCERTLIGWTLAVKMTQYGEATLRRCDQARLKMRFIRNHVRRVLAWIVRRHPYVAYDALKQSRDHSFAALPDGPQRNFEDICWMLDSNPTNKGLLILELDE